MPAPISRRQLLAGGATIGGLGFGSFLMTTGDEPPHKRSLNEVAGLFQIGAGIVPMNAANLTPMFHSVSLKVAEYSRLLNDDVSFINRRNIVKDRVEPSRAKLAAMLGISDPEDIALLRNTSEANAVICNGLTLAADDEVLIWSENHATNNRSWFYRQQRDAFKIRQVQLPDQLLSQQQVLDAFISQLGPKTRVVTFTELSNISGTRVPAKVLCQAIHAYNPDIFVHVDGAQSWGCIDLNLADMDCDSFSSSAHKWFMGPRGTGILYVKKAWASRIWPAILGYDFLLDYPLEELPGNARRFECIGQRDVAPYAAIGDCVELHNQLGGGEVIETRVQTLTRYLLDALQSAGINTITPPADGLGHAVVVIDMGNTLSAYGGFLALHNQGIASAFITGNRVCCSPTAGLPHTKAPTYLRLSPHIYNSRDDIDRAVEVITRVHRSKFEIVKEVVRFL